jgi:PD-(D/E)XK nuclease superfamily
MSSLLYPSSQSWTWGTAVLNERELVVSQNKRIYRLTPGQLDVYQDCGYKFAADLRVKRQGSRHKASTSYNLALGKAVHEAINLTNRVLLRGETPPSTDEILERYWNPSHFAGPEQALEGCYAAESMIANYQMYLSECGFRLLASEQFIKTPVMTVAGRVPLVLSGKIDALLQDQDGALMSMDWKTGNCLSPSEVFARRLSTIAYRCLVGLIHPEASTIRIGQVLLSAKVPVVVDVPEDVYEACKQQIRDLVIAMDGDSDMTGPLFQPRAGEQCAWCPHQDTCPLFSDGAGLVEAAF